MFVFCSTSKVMSAPPAAGPKQTEQQQPSNDASVDTTSAPRSIPASSQKHAKAHHRHSAASNHDAASPSQSNSPLLSSSSSSPGSYFRKQRYGKWPHAGSSLNEHTSSNSRKAAGSTAGGVNVGRTFTWPAYMDRQQLQQSMKRGHVFRLVWALHAKTVQLHVALQHL